MQFSNFTVTPSAITPCGEDKVKINFTIIGMHNMKTMFDIPVSGKQVLSSPHDVPNCIDLFFSPSRR
jgi:hypothetical protein